MRMCPKCKTPTLAPLGSARVAADPEQVPPSRCSTCSGVWMPHEAVSERLVPTSIDEPAAREPSQRDRVPGICPRCRGLMVRARVSDENPFHLDRCPVCRGIFFDAGEWAAVAASEWLAHLDDLWDPVWRRRVREERAYNRHHQAMRDALGEEAYAKVTAAIEALRRNPQRSLGLSFIIEELRG